MKNWHIPKLNKESHNAGFTLVELVVVLALMAILLGVMIFGGLGWQAWMQFRHENSVAEELFFAAQNQLVELDSSGAMERTVQRPIQTNGIYDSEYVLASHSGKAGDNANEGDLTSIIPPNGSDEDKCSWNGLWADSAESGSAIGLNVNKKDARTIIKLKAKKGDYDKYLTYKESSASARNSMLKDPDDGITAGAVLLFDLVAPYISDKSALNGAIALEFSPETGQVFSALYSDRASALSYEPQGDSSVVSVLDRRIAAREPLMLGYYGVDQLTEKIRGKGVENNAVRLELRNEDVLSLVIHDNDGTSFKSHAVFDIVIYDGDSDNTGSTKAMSFTLEYDKIPEIETGGDMLTKAAESPLTISNVEFYQGDYQKKTLPMRFPVWKEGSEIHLILDAADVQAQTSVYGQAKAESASEKLAAGSKSEAFRNTYSFYRFGLDRDVNYVYASVEAKSSPDANATPIFSERYMGGVSGENPTGYKPHQDLYVAGGSCGECTTFASYALKNDQVIVTGEDGNEESSVIVEKRHFEIANARHLYNMRYETEVKGFGSKDNVFTLISDIDWNAFVNKSASSDKYNNFLNSYDTSYDNFSRVTAGIDYDGNNIATGEKGVKTKDMPFPGFRCLGKGDTFTQAVPYEVNEEGSASGDSYVISNLKISFAANVVYGLYDDVLDTQNGSVHATDGKIVDKDDNVLYEVDPALKSNCMDGDFSGLLGLQYTTVDEINSHGNSTRSKLARGGAMPLGLFCENLGTISNITLDKHVVEGLTDFVSDSDTNQLIYTCMVGGFAGNNLGYINNLTLLSSQASEIESETHVNGRTDVGGIVGRQSFVAADNSSSVEITGMKNYGTVTGMENIGGIVGRAYVNYVGDPSSEHRKDYYDNSLKKVVNETEVRKYHHYHDGYYITDSFKSMTGESVKRATTVLIKNCINRGTISGDDLLSKGTMDMVVLDNTEKDPSKVDTKVKGYEVNGTATRCANIGGIAGITMDGLMVDDRNIKATASQTVIASCEFVTTGNSNTVAGKVCIEECESFTVFDETDIMALNAENYAGLRRDYYVGGIVGYSRLTQIKGCDIQPSDTDGVVKNDVPMAYVIGAKYVGGIAGCSDLTKYNAGDKSQVNEETGKTYNVINYNNVIGRVYVGGIAGAFGVGGYTQQAVTFRDPSANDGSRPSQYAETTRYTIASNMLNTGIVLSIKSDNPFYSNESTEERNLANKNSQAGSCGGIAGVTRYCIYNSDNIQSEAVKQYLLKLVNGGTDVNLSELTADSVVSMVSTSRYGGNMVGGIVGSVIANGVVNPSNSAATSYIDAVVFGENQVGGGVGYVEATDNSEAYNLLPMKTTGSSGMYVIGSDIVGGIVGDHHKKYAGFTSNNSKKTMESAYTVIGRYSVGGICGRINNISKKSPTVEYSVADEFDGQIKVEGKAYVGGLSGVVDSYGSSADNDIGTGLKGTLKHMTINGDYFVGGIVGAITTIDNNTVDDYILNNQVYADSSVHVNAKAFAGGVAGLYLNGTSSTLKNFQSRNGTNKTGTLIALLSDNSGASRFSGVGDVYEGIVAKDLLGEINALKESENAMEMTFSAQLNEASVSADIFAGGLFGYVPEGTKITVKKYANASSVCTTGFVGGNSGVKVNESFSNNTKYSYLGGVIGRVPMGMTLEDCSNTVSGYTKNGDGSLDKTHSYYYTAQAGYLGGLTEVNAGRIMGGTKNKEEDTTAYETDTAYIDYLVNTTDYDYSSTTSLKGIGAFAGINGTKYTDGDNNGIIAFCSNRATIKAETAAGIAAVMGGRSDIRYCENRGNIYSSDSADGIAAGIVASVTDGINKNSSDITGTLVENLKVTGCINIGDVNKANAGVKGKYSAGIVYHTGGCGKLTKCRNYGPGADYGITGTEAALVTENLEASGLNEKEGKKYPIAPMASSALEKNFYVYGNSSDNTAGSGEDVPNGIIEPKIPTANTGKVHFVVKKDGRVAEDLYDRTETSNNQQLKYMQVSPYSKPDESVKVEYEVITNNTPNGVFMKDFTFVLGYQSYASNQRYVYDVTFDYIDTDGTAKSVTVRRNVTDNKPAPIVDVVPSPGDEYRITKVTFSSDIHFEEYQELNITAVNWQYVCAYWTDAYPIHYVNKNDENLDGIGDDIYFYATQIYTHNQSPTEVTEIYNRTSTSDVARPWVGTENGNSVLDYNLRVQGHFKGVPADKIRIYFGNTRNSLFHKNQDRLQYVVKSTYIDSNGEEKTITDERDIRVSNTAIPFDFYDEIPIRTEDNYRVYLNNFEMIIDNKTGQGGNLDYYAIVWVDENGNEWPIANKQMKYTLNDVNTRTSRLNTDFIKAVNYASSSTTKKNHWPLQLLYNNAGPNLVYMDGDVAKLAIALGVNSPVSNDFYTNLDYRLTVIKDLDPRFLNMMKERTASDFIAP